MGRFKFFRLFASSFLCIAIDTEISLNNGKGVFVIHVTSKNIFMSTEEMDH